MAYDQTTADLLRQSDGWKLVPIEPTPEMIDAACCGWVIRDREMRKRLKIYRAMIAAAPNAAGEVRRNAVTSTGLLADESKGA